MNPLGDFRNFRRNSELRFVALIKVVSLANHDVIKKLDRPTANLLVPHARRINLTWIP